MTVGTRAAAPAATRLQATSAFRVWLGLCLLLGAAVLISLAIGRYGIPVSRVVEILVTRLLTGDFSDLAVDERVVLLIRAPRVLTAVLAGAALGICGAALQGIFSNPLVGPQIIGVSNGAAFGGALGLLMFNAMGYTVVLAFVFGLVAIAMVYGLAYVAGRASILSLVLAGVVISALFSALVSAIKYLADPLDRLPAIVYWLLGSFATATYEKLAVLAPVALVAGCVLFGLRFRINILALGDEEARALGVSVDVVRWIVLIAVAFAVAATVSVSGVIGWVGLIIPHMARMLVGESNRLVLPASALLGGTYLLVVDNMARTLSPGEIPVGVITALVGAPVFGYLFWRTQRSRNG